MRYRAAPATALVIVPLDAFAAVYHRASGITHLLAEPAPEMLDALAEPVTEADLNAALAARYDLADAGSLPARLAELVAAGLVERV